MTPRPGTQKTRDVSQKLVSVRRRKAARRRRLVLGAGGLLVVVAVLLAVFSSGRSAAPGTTDAEAWDLPRLGGEGRVQLADFEGKPVVVNFFASWCTACDFELPGFRRVSEELKGDVAFVGVASLETGDPMTMPERHDITWWPLARDIGGRDGSGLHAALGGRGMPITAFYDADGKLVDLVGGALPEEALRERIRGLYGIEV